MVIRSVLRNRDVRRLLGAYSMFAVCEQAMWIAVLVYAYQHGGATEASWVAIVQIVPSAGVALAAGPLTARFSHVTVLIGSYAGQAICALATAALLVADAPRLAVYAGAVVVSSSIPLVRPVQAALLPTITTESAQLSGCVVVIGAVESISVLVAGTMTGLALAFGSVGVVFMMTAALLLASAVVTLTLQHLPHLGGPVEPDSRPSADEASAEPAQRRRLTWGLAGLLGSEFMVIGALDLLFVVLAVDVLAAGQAWVGYLNTAYGAGALAAGALGAFLVGRRLGPVIIVTATVLGAALAATVIGDLLPVVLLLALVGACRYLFDVAVRVLLQRCIAPEHLARLFGAAEGLSMLGLGLGTLLVPALIALGGTSLALVGVATLVPLHVLAVSRIVLRADRDARVPVVEISLLRRISLFKVLPGPQMEALAQVLHRVEYPSGHPLTEQGTQGDLYYALAEGEVLVKKDGLPIARLGRGEGFGEIALLSDVPRTATAVAVTPVVAYTLDRNSFVNAVTGHPATHSQAHAVVTSHEERDLDRQASDEASSPPG